MNIKNIIKKNKLEHLFIEGSFGLEKEGLRVHPDGKLALTDHPDGFGSRTSHPYVQTDFSESQLELVTPAVYSKEEVTDWLRSIQDIAYQTLPENELIWPFSMPSIIPEENQIPIVKVEDQHEIDYRLGLAERYGRKKQLISGLHYNFMFSKAFMDGLFEGMDEEQKKQAKEEALLKMARNYMRYHWLLTYLLGSTPIQHETMNDSIDQFIEEVQPVRSLRNGPSGYTNSADNSVSYQSYKEYVADLKRMVEEDTLIEEREYYGTIRLRGRKTNDDLLDNGLNYFELRSFDLNPFSDLGISKEDIDLIHLTLLLMMWTDRSSNHEDTIKGIKMNQETAMEHPSSESAFKEEGLALLDEMRQMTVELGIEVEMQQIIDDAIAAFEQPENTRAAKVMHFIKEQGSFIDAGIHLAEEYKEDSLEAPYRLRGFEEMEMSTQLLISDAIKKGVQVRILDKEDQFLELKYNDKIEYVKNGNMTSKDSYISPLLMGNKTVTKKVLRENGYVVPDGEEYHSANEAKKNYWRVEGKQFVVKPKSTNYGVGITVFKQAASQEAYEEAIDIAFKEDSAVLVEAFAHGTEYRFFVLNGQTEAVLLRIPANVKGDGKRTIRALVEEKNTHPYRGENHRAPLEKIKLGEIEQLMLKEQGYKPDSIPEVEQVVYLRENSNVSTGGDSIDFTSRMHESYKRIAAEIAEKMDAKVCGVDLMIEDYTNESTKDDPGYIALEANYNPAMHMHAYVYEGEGQRLTEKIIEMLYPETK